MYFFPNKSILTLLFTTSPAATVMHVTSITCMNYCYDFWTLVCLHFCSLHSVCSPHVPLLYWRPLVTLSGPWLPGCYFFRMSSITYFKFFYNFSDFIYNSFFMHGIKNHSEFLYSVLKKIKARYQSCIWGSTQGSWRLVKHPYPWAAWRNVS